MTRASLGTEGPHPSDAAREAYYTFSTKLVALESPPKSRAAVAVHEMAANLIAQQVDRGRRGVAVCSPHARAGSSLICANLAIAIAQVGVSVLLVDANLHDPALSALIAPSEPTIGLQQVLRSAELTAEDALHPEILPGLSLLYAGGACEDASELISSARCAELLSATLRNYDYTIVDTPPANRSNDARRVAAAIGYGLIVARRNRTYIDDVATLHGELVQDRAQVIGTIYIDA